MNIIEELLVKFTLLFSEAESINAFFRNPQNTAVLVGACIAIAGGILGTFLLLRKMSLTSDAISHTVLLGIVVAFMIIVGFGGGEPDLGNPWLIIGATFAGVATTVLTELVYKSGLVKQDAALGLVFPLLFALSIILVSRYVDDVHLDEDAVMVGEIGVAWANTESYIISGSTEAIIIEEGDSRVEYRRECLNCQELGISPRDPRAEFRLVPTNLGRYSPAEAYRLGYIDEPPIQVFWPKAVTSTLLLVLLTLLFSGLFFKELKLTSFDPELAASLGVPPGVFHYSLMVMVSLVAVGAFDAVGSILVIAFFIIPPATAYLLTEKVEMMLVLSALFGSLSAFFGYYLASWWDSSISASMVVVMFGFLLLAWLFSPSYGLILGWHRRNANRRRFEEMMMLGHLNNHQGTARETVEQRLATMSSHIRWEQKRVLHVAGRLLRRGLVHKEKGIILMTDLGRKRIREFKEGLERTRME